MKNQLHGKQIPDHLSHQAKGLPMTLQEAQVEIISIMGRLRAIRDDLGQQLVEKRCDDAESRRLSELHDRAAHAISAYNRGA